MFDQPALPFEEPSKRKRKAPVFPDTPDGDVAREAWEWAQARRVDRKAPPRDLKPEDVKPKEQQQGTRSYREPTAEERLAAAEQAAETRALWRAQMKRT